MGRAPSWGPGDLTSSIVQVPGAVPVTPARGPRSTEPGLGLERQVLELEGVRRANELEMAALRAARTRAEVVTTLALEAAKVVMEDAAAMAAMAAESKARLVEAWAAVEAEQVLARAAACEAAEVERRAAATMAAMVEAVEERVAKALAAVEEMATVTTEVTTATGAGEGSPVEAGPERTASGVAQGATVAAKVEARLRKGRKAWKDKANARRLELKETTRTLHQLEVLVGRQKEQLAELTTESSAFLVKLILKGIDDLPPSMVHLRALLQAQLAYFNSKGSKRWYAAPLTLSTPHACLQHHPL